MFWIDLIPLLKSWKKALDCINHVIYTPVILSSSSINVGVTDLLMQVFSNYGIICVWF